MLTNPPVPYDLFIFASISTPLSKLRDLNEQKMYMQTRRKARLTTDRMK